nr:Tyr p 1 allergen [Tyrophagus putrescentiae]
MALLFYILFLFFTFIQCRHLEKVPTWEQYKVKFGKNYLTINEENFRKNNYYNSLTKIFKNNGKNGVTLGLNDMSDWSDEEFFSLNSKSPSSVFVSARPTSTVNTSPFPKSWDWRNIIAFNSIEQQGRCSSCWAFAAATTVEAAYAHQKNMHNLHLSRQELVDCTNRTFDQHYLNYGCKGGWPTEAYKYIMDHGVYEDKLYHYTETFNEVCYADKVAHDKGHPVKYYISNYGRLAYNDTDEAIMAMLVTYGPGTVDIHGTSDTFRFYKGGIMRNVMPNSAYTNHIVVVVGYGTDSSGVDYWIIRNSWGKTWGEHGYGRLERHHNLLGFNNKYNYPIL